MDELALWARQERASTPKESINKVTATSKCESVAWSKGSQVGGGAGARTVTLERRDAGRGLGSLLKT